MSIFDVSLTVIGKRNCSKEIRTVMQSIQKSGDGLKGWGRIPMLQNSRTLTLHEFKPT